MMSVEIDNWVEEIVFDRRIYDTASGYGFDNSTGYGCGCPSGYGSWDNIGYGFTDTKAGDGNDVGHGGHTGYEYYENTWIGCGYGY